MTDNVETEVNEITASMNSMDIVENSEENDESESESEDSGPEELPYPNLTITIPSGAIDYESPATPTYSAISPPMTPVPAVLPDVPQHIVEDIEAELHAMETEEEAFNDEEKVETKQEEKVPVIDEEDLPSCGVCYIELNSDNTVNTNCNHKFCNKCFFRWIKVQARCPMCRKHFRTDVDLSDEEIARENTEVYDDYINNLEKYVSITAMANNEFSKVSRLREERSNLLRCQISLKEQIEQTRGFNDGLVAAGYKNIDEEIPWEINLKYQVNKRIPDYIHGWRTGLRIERERLEKERIMNHIRNKNYIIPKRKKKSNKRQADLFSFGFNMDNKVSKTCAEQKRGPVQQTQKAIKFSFDFVPPKPNDPPVVFSFNE
jgi:hypothetical protein